MKTLQDIPVGGRAAVVRLHGEGPVKRRMMDMGITRGVTLSVCGVAPLGDPIELKLRGYSLSIRREDAERVEVEALPGPGGRP